MPSHHRRHGPAGAALKALKGLCSALLQAWVLVVRMIHLDSFLFHSHEAHSVRRFRPLPPNDHDVCGWNVPLPAAYACYHAPHMPPS